jgi:hypothetical protein
MSSVVNRFEYERLAKTRNMPVRPERKNMPRGMFVFEKSSGLPTTITVKVLRVCRRRNTVRTRSYNQECSLFRLHFPSTGMRRPIIWHARETLFSCFPNSNSPTFVLMIFIAVVIPSLLSDDCEDFN